VTDSAPRASRLLAEMAHTLESGEDAKARVGRVLALLRELVPYDRCALLDSLAGREPELRVVPSAAAQGQEELFRKLSDFLRLLDDRGEVREERVQARTEGAPPLAVTGGHHLALPLVGLEEVIGVLFIERQGGEPYDEHSLSLLTVVAAQIASYLTTIRLREEQSQSGHALGLAHAFQQLLVGIVSHDLRNPLGAILGSAGILLGRTDDPRQVKTVQRIVSNAHRAVRIINDLLDLTRARLGDGIPITRQRFELGELLREIVDEMADAHRGRQLGLEAVDPVVGEWDRDRIAQAVTNLLTNALHHGQPDVPVRVALRAELAAAVIEVHNRGPTIPPETLRLIFDPFKRGVLPSREGQVQGLGLGLYIVERVIAAHGGRVDARSTEAEGTTFTIVLPR
jgi:signal transduction histidine kinase